MKLAAEWKNDCQGKKDYDGSILDISSRFWPGAGEGAMMIANGQISTVPWGKKPSATSSLNIVLVDDDTIEIARQDFEADTEEEVKRQVEEWAQAQMDKAVAVLFQAFEYEKKEVE